MSQYLLPTIDPSVNTGSQLSAWLNLWAQAVQTQQMGASRPVDAPAGMIWIKDVSPVLQQLMLFDGADDLELLNWNPSTNVVSYPGAVKGPASSDIYNIALWGGDNGDTLLDSGFEIQSSVTDAATNKVMRVGAFGLGTTDLADTSTDLNNISATGFYFVIGANQPPGQNGGFLIVVSNGSGPVSCSQRYISQEYLREFIRIGIVGGTWTPWVEVWTTGNLVKQTSATDTTAGAMMAVGAFGLGATGANMPNIDSIALPTGFYSYSESTAGSKPSNWGNVLIIAGEYGSWDTQIAFTTASTVFTRVSINGAAWSAWREFAFTAGSAFTGETQFESIKASGTVKSTGGQVSAADMEAFTAVQVNEAGQPLPPTFLADLENQITAMQAQITALQAQVEALTP